MQGLFIEVRSSYLAEVSTEGISAELAAGIIYRCLYPDLGLNGPSSVRLGKERDGLDPAQMQLHMQVTLGITGIDERDLPSSDVVAQTVARYVTLAFCDVVRSVEDVRVRYATLEGAWDVYEPPPSFDALTTVKGVLSA